MTKITVTASLSHPSSEETDVNGFGDAGGAGG